MSDLDYDIAAIDALKWDENGLVPVIAQDAKNAKVLMFAWTNRAGLEECMTSGYAVYWSRTRQKLWRKGEDSGHQQRIVYIRTDCDGDVLLLGIEQTGDIACHTGRNSCFFNELQNGRWTVREPVLRDPKEIYKK